MKLTAKQYEAITRARYGLGPRPPRSVVPPITKRDYEYVLNRWAGFDRWKAWRDVGGDRPAGVWRSVPKWDDPKFTPWDLLRAIRLRFPLRKTLPDEPPAPPPPAHSLALGQSWFVIAQNYRAAVFGPDYFGRAFTADPAYEHPTREEVAAYRARGIRTAVWGDSRPGGDGTTAEAIVELANELRVDRPMFQAERLDEYRASVAMVDRLGGNGHLLIANRSSIAEDTTTYRDFIGRVNRGNLLVLSECYRNCGWGLPDYAGLPFASTLGATYRDAECEGLPASEYYRAGWIAAHRDSWYTAGWDTPDYAAAR